MSAPHRILVQLRHAREDQDISKISLAQTLGYHRATLLRCEAGEHSPRLDTLVAWASALGYDIALVPRRPALQTVVRKPNKEAQR